MCLLNHDLKNKEQNTLNYKTYLCNIWHHNKLSSHYGNLAPRICWAPHHKLRFQNDSFNNGTHTFHWHLLVLYSALCHKYLLYIYNWRMKNNEVLYLWTTLYHRHIYRTQNVHPHFNISCESSLQAILVNNGLVYTCQNMILITGKNWILTNILLQKCPSLAIR